jgi:murein DD-endopeptidase MepM/ murein hydrolase activator NlpD
MDHGGEVLSVYAHLSQLLVHTGDVVGGRAVIGLSGQTGDATGPHLHFEEWVNGWRTSSASAPVDPLPQLKAWAGRS